MSGDGNADIYAEVDEIRRQSLTLRIFYDHLQQEQSSDILTYFAYAVYRLVLEMRKLQGVDLRSAGSDNHTAFPLGAIASVVPFLDSVIEGGLDRLEAISGPEKIHGQLAYFARVQAGHAWKCYLQSICTYPIYWEANSILALRCFRIVATANGKDVIALTQHYLQQEPALRSQIKSDDWPLAGFVNFYTKHERLVEKRFSELPDQEDQLEILKMIARRGTMRRVMQREAGAREPASRLVARAAKMRSLASVMNACGEMNADGPMKREDFCEVVVLAIRAGELPEDAAPMAVYLREWVLTDGDRLMPFPDWFASEGAERLSKLNQEWVGSVLRGETARNTTFHQWLLLPRKSQSKAM